MNTESLNRAVAAVGTRYQLAKLIGLRPPSVYGWKEVPVVRVLAVEEATGISRHDLRPDVFGPAPEAEARP